MVRSFHKKVSLTVRNTFIYVPIATLYSDHIDTFRKLYVTFCMWNELTFLWNELTFFWGGGDDLTNEWNDPTMEGNDRIPTR